MKAHGNTVLMGRKLYVLLLLLSVALSGCGDSTDDRMKVSTTNWIGFTPLFYADAKGWLDPYNIELLQVVSLSENVYLFEAGNSDAFVGTQYEYNILASSNPQLVPVMLFDRSFGGDVVMSNVELNALKQAGSIDVYLEMDSVNLTVLQDFARQHQLNPAEFKYHNLDQALISNLEAASMSGPTVLVTYNPYNFTLMRRGFSELATTRDNLDLLVIDALFTRLETLQRRSTQFAALKRLTDNAITAMLADPQEYFSTIQPYLQNMTYDEFAQSMDNVLWLNRSLVPAIAERLAEGNFPIRHLLSQ